MNEPWDDMSDTTRKTTPYFQVKVRNSLFAWLDLLGFSEMIQSSNEKQLNELVMLLKGSIEKAKEHFKAKYDKAYEIDASWECKAFSDNIILAYPAVNENGFEIAHSIYMAARYQFDMIRHGFFVRGAMSIGDTFVNSDMLVSKALLETYHDESKFAINPRIVISNTLKRVIDERIIAFTNTGTDKPLFDALLESLLIDDDGWYFIDYLGIVAGAGEDNFEECLKRHRDVICYKLMQHSNEPKVYSKYQWAAKYHNYFCQTNPEKWAECGIETEFKEMSRFQQIGEAKFTDYKQ
jgi:hypothetical protein